MGGPEVLLYYRRLLVRLLRHHPDAFFPTAGYQYVLNSALSRSKQYYHHVCFQQRAPSTVFLFSETEACQLRGQSWVPSGRPPTRDQNTQTCVCALFISLNNDASFLGHRHGRSSFTDSLVITFITSLSDLRKARSRRRRDRGEEALQMAHFSRSNTQLSAWRTSHPDRVFARRGV